MPTVMRPRAYSLSEERQKLACTPSLRKNKSFSNFEQCRGRATGLAVAEVGALLGPAVRPISSLAVDGLLTPPAGHQRSPFVLLPDVAKKKQVGHVPTDLLYGALQVTLMAIAGGLVQLGFIVVAKTAIDSFCDAKKVMTYLAKILCLDRLLSMRAPRGLSEWLLSGLAYVVFVMLHCDAVNHLYTRPKEFGNLRSYLLYHSSSSALKSGDALEANDGCKRIMQSLLAAGRRVPTNLIDLLADSSLLLERFAEAKMWAFLSLARNRDSKMLLVMAEASLRECDLVHAELQVKKFMRINSLVAGDKVQASLLLGDTLMAANQMEAAFDAYTEALKQDKMSHRAALGCIWTLRLLGRHEDAEQARRYYMQLGRTTNNRVYFILAGNHFVARGYDACEQALLIAQRANPAGYLPPSKRLLLADAQYKQRKLEPARINYVKYLQEIPSDSVAQMRLLRLEWECKWAGFPSLHALPWSAEGVAQNEQARCLISFSPFEDLVNPVVYRRGNGRYYFEYDDLRQFHDAFKKDFFEDGPFAGHRLLRVAAVSQVEKSAN